MHYLFIYGTLKRGFPNFVPFMNNAHYIGNVQTTLPFPLVIGGKWFSPCLIDEQGVGTKVMGELFQVSDEDLEKLDLLEATHLPNGYRRITIEICGIDQSRCKEAWTYVKDRAVIEGIHSEPFNEYKLDTRYIPLSKRPS